MAEIALGSVVVGGDLGMVEEGEEVLAQQAVALAQSLPMAVGGGERHDGVEVALETAPVLATRALGEAAMAAGQHNGAQQQRLHARGEDGVARLNGVAAVAELMHDPNAIDAMRFVLSLPFA